MIIENELEGKFSKFFIIKDDSHPEKSNISLHSSELIYNKNYKFKKLIIKINTFQQFFEVLEI